MRRLLKVKFLASLVILTLFLSSCGKKESPKDKRIYLNEWDYSLDGKTFFQVPEGSLGTLVNLIPERKGFVTLHTEFELPWQMLTDDVSLAIGSISVASKIYLNGKELGETGIFPPHSFDSGKAYSNIRLSPQILNLEKNTLEIVLWTDGTGGVSGRPFVSTFVDSARYVNLKNLQVSKLNMIFSWTMILCGIVYLLFYVQQKRDHQYRDYALMSLWTSLYLLPQWLSEVPTMIGIMPLLLWTKFFNGAVAIIVCYYATSFIRSFLGIETSKKIRICRRVIMATGIVVILLCPSLVFFYRYIWILFLFLGVELAFGVSALYVEWKNKNPNFIRLILGYSPVLVTLIIDLIVKVILKNSLAPVLTIYGWQLTTITFIAIVTRRYSRIRMQFEYLNENLEKEVQERTRELTVANEELEHAQYEAARDMEMAVHVQKSFYSQIPDFKGWDIAVSFNPLSGVSGDLYDFYQIDGKLCGFGLFDVSGHGISSGLVTMLAKNAIFHAFRSTREMRLDKAGKVINDQIIHVKGDIENYLTGVMFRIDEKKPNKLEFVNAGAPHPVYVSGNGKKAEQLLPDENKPQYGMLGIRDMDIELQVIKKTLKVDDFLVLYTDGLTETENAEGEAYGKERLLELLSNRGLVKGSTAQFVASGILQDVKNFAGDGPLGDDVTIVVLKRTADDSVEAEEELLELESI